LVPRSLSALRKEDEAHTSGDSQENGGSNEDATESALRGKISDIKQRLNLITLEIMEEGSLEVEKHPLEAEKAVKQKHKAKK
jgi:hypothetical protein